MVSYVAKFIELKLNCMSKTEWGNNCQSWSSKGNCIGGRGGRGVRFDRAVSGGIASETTIHSVAFVVDFAIVDRLYHPVISLLADWTEEPLVGKEFKLIVTYWLDLG